MDRDIVEIFKEKNKQILINSLQYDIEKNITSLLETITNIFNLEFDTAIRNIVSIYEDAQYVDSRKFIIDTINKIKIDSFQELENLLNDKKNALEEAISQIEFDEDHIHHYYDIVFETTKKLKDSFNMYCVQDIQEQAFMVFQKHIDSSQKEEINMLLLSRVRDYIQNRLYGKLETKIHMEIMLRDNNLINKAKEGYLRYQEICAKTEER